MLIPSSLPFTTPVLLAMLLVHLYFLPYSKSLFVLKYFFSSNFYQWNTVHEKKVFSVLSFMWVRHFFNWIVRLMSVIKAVLISQRIHPHGSSQKAWIKNPNHRNRRGWKVSPECKIYVVIFVILLVLTLLCY